MLDQPFMTDIIEASSISHMPQVIDIYSASWGPTDDGKTVDGPRELTLQAMADGVNKVARQQGEGGVVYVRFYFLFCQSADSSRILIGCLVHVTLRELGRNKVKILRFFKFLNFFTFTNIYTFYYLHGKNMFVFFV